LLVADLARLSPQLSELAMEEQTPGRSLETKDLAVLLEQKLAD